MKYFVRAFAALALVAILATASAAPAWADARADFQTAFAAKRAGNLDQAIRFYTKVIESGEFSGKNLAITYYNRGDVYDDQRRFNRAIADYTRAMELRANYADAYGNRGVTYEKMGRRKKAVADYRQAVRIRPNDPVGTVGLKRLGTAPSATLAAPVRANDRADCDNGSRDVAIAACTRLIMSGRLNTKRLAITYYQRALAYEKKGRKGLAIQDYRAGQRLTPGDLDYAMALKRLGATP